MDSGGRRAAQGAGSRGGRSSEKSVAVLYLENPSGAKEEEYLRDGVTEDIITELTKIQGLKIFSRPTVLPYRDKPVTPAQIGQQLGAACVLAGSLRRAGSRLRINAQLIDTHTDFPLWTERYDREMADVFELQDEIAHKIAEAIDALAKAWKAGFRDPDWTRRDPDLVLLHGDAEFERLYPASPTTG